MKDNSELKYAAYKAIWDYVDASMPRPDTIFYRVTSGDVDDIVSSVMKTIGYDLWEAHSFYNEANDEGEKVDHD